MTNYTSGISRPAALDSARGEFEVARLVYVHLPDGGAQITRHLHDCWLSLLNILLLNHASAADLEELSHHEKLSRIPADKMKLLSDSLGATWQEKLGTLLEHPSRAETSSDMLAATQKILAAVTKDLQGESGRRTPRRLHRLTGPVLAPLILVLGCLYLARAWTMRPPNSTDWFSLDVDQFRIIRSEQAWGALRLDSSVTGTPLTINGKRYDKGLGTHARSSIELKLSHSARQFYGACGVDGGACSTASVKCAIYAADKLLFESGLLRFNEPAKEFRVPVEGVNSLTLLVLDGGDGGRCDHADWVNLRVTPP